MIGTDVGEVESEMVGDGITGFPWPFVGLEMQNRQPWNTLGAVRGPKC
jgi:hypothetical protein